MAKTAEELEKLIATLEDVDPDSDKLKEYKAELAKLSSGGEESADFVISGVSEEDYNSAGSKFANPGLHLSEFGMPYWKTTGVSMGFPFTIVEGEDKGKEGEIFVGVALKAVWKLKEVLEAMGIKPGKNKAGNITFNPDAVVGSRAMTLWALQRDSRSEAEGGKGGIYTKPVSVFPEGTPPPADLGI